MYLISLILTVISVQALAYNGRRLDILFKEPPIIPMARDAKAPITKLMLQKVDNFDPQDKRQWNMRYMENEQFYKPGGPFFIFVGGEWEIFPNRITGGHMFDMAKELNGYMFYTEHRFYGLSRPTVDTSVKNLKYLSVDQSLADLAHFIRKMKAFIPGANDSGVILVGGSYSSSMVTWFRQKYPHLVSGAWASSGPLLAKLDFVEYKEVVTASIKLVGGDACAGRIESAFAQMEKLVTLHDTSKIVKDFKLCDNIRLDYNLDIWNFFSSVTDQMAGAVQGHRNETRSIQKMCEYILEEKHTDDIAAVGSWFSRYADNCLDMTYKTMIEFYQKTGWNDPAATGAGRMWMYQTCAEFGWYQTSGSKNQIFGSSFPLDLFVQICRDLYDNVFDQYDMEQNVARVNSLYGHMNPAVTNVFFTQGQLDPWRPMGIQTILNSESPAYVIPLAAHCNDFNSISKNDSDDMRAVKLMIFEYVKKWLNV